jgi:putative spermidine/putrescine transport system ATP-binding protein
MILAGRSSGVRFHEQEARPEATAVELVGLTRRYGKIVALDELDLRLEAGELVVLLGPSGCGKTTALRILAGFERPDAGRVLLGGADVTAVAPQHRGMGMVFQGYSLFPTMTAEENVAFGLRLRKVARPLRRRRALELLELVGLLDRARDFPHQLSGGQRQRVALARALAIEPRVLLLDEPLSALDAKVRAQLREHIRSLQQRLGITTLFVTHDQEEALSIADRVGVMRAGRLEQLAPPAVLYGEPTTSFVAQFVGTMNRLPALGNGRTVTVLGRTVPLRGQAAMAQGEVEVLVRPEGLSLARDLDGDGIVMTKIFLGYLTRVEVLLSPKLVVKVDCPSALAAQVEVGERVKVELLATQALLAEEA